MNNKYSCSNYCCGFINWKQEKEERAGCGDTLWAWPLSGDLAKSRTGQGYMSKDVVRVWLKDWAVSQGLMLSCHCLILV